MEISMERENTYSFRGIERSDLMIINLQEQKNEKLAQEIIEWCKKNEFGDTRVYRNGKATDIDYDGRTKEIENINPVDYDEYSNPDTVTMTFEGTLYHLLAESSVINNQLQAMFEKYGMYFEQGYAWSLSGYAM